MIELLLVFSIAAEVGKAQTKPVESQISTATVSQPREKIIKQTNKK